MRARASPGAAVEIDMTPMIDVVFQLIIFFTVVSTYNEMEREARLELPVAYQAIIEKNVAQERMIINIERDGTIMLFNQPMNEAGLREKMRVYGPGLRTLGSRTGQAPIVLRGDKECLYKNVRGILAVIYEEGFTKIMFAAYQKEEEATGE